jgi:hypothetical protein
MAAGNLPTHNGPVTLAPLCASRAGAALLHLYCKTCKVASIMQPTRPAHSAHTNRKHLMNIAHANALVRNYLTAWPTHSMQQARDWAATQYVTEYERVPHASQHKVDETYAMVYNGLIANR